MSFASNIGCNAASLKEFPFSEECLAIGILEMSKLQRRLACELLACYLNLCLLANPQIFLWQSLGHSLMSKTLKVGGLGEKRDVSIWCSRV